jgi:hypothetical protein
VAAELLALSMNAVDTLPDTEREQLLSILQDTMNELPNGKARRRGLPCAMARRGNRP